MPPHAATDGSATTVVSECELAWNLADAVREQVSPEERTAIYTLLGSSDYLSAIELILRVMIQRGMPLPAPLIVRLRLWMRGYDREREFKPMLASLARRTP